MNNLLFRPSTYGTVTAVNSAGLADELAGPGPLTVFAPTNSAFDKLPVGLVTKLLEPTWKPQLVDLLLYHVLSTTVVSPYPTRKYTTLNKEDIYIRAAVPEINKSSRVVAKDILASNGVIHAIDTVLTPTSVTDNIVDIAAGNDNFSTLVAALTAAGLVDDLEGDGPFTVFGE